MKIKTANPNDLKLHPLAYLIPDMRPDEWQEFYRDVASRGIKTPLEVLADGTVIDGRHRLKAAKQLAMKEVPIMDALLGSDNPEVYMMKAAVLRRHLTDDQRACIAELWKQENKKQGQRTDLTSIPHGMEVPATAFSKKNPTCAEAMKTFKVSYKKIDKAAEVYKVDPELFQAVHQGDTTLSNAYRKAKEISRKQQSVSAQTSYPAGQQIFTGAATLLEEKLPDESVDLFFTDPPYREADLGLYSELAKLARAKLKPSGICLVYCPHPYLDQVLALMSEHLNYWWIFAVLQTGGQPRIWNERIWVSWKPILGFTKYSDTSQRHGHWLSDSYRGGGEDKRYHQWGQDIREAMYFIEKLCPVNGLVVDPFCGGGTILLASKLTHRNWLGVDIDEAYTAISRKRLAESDGGS